MTETHRAKATQTLPALIEAPRQRPSLARYRLPASFASQLLAAREHLPTQRAIRRAPVNVAHSAYAKGLTVTVKRLPAGYRLSASA
jgi:hypothetical protein